MGDKTFLHGKLLLVTQLHLATGGTVAGAFYGMAFTLYCFYALSLAAQLRSPGLRRQAQFLFAYSTIIMSLGLFNVAANGWIINKSYIGHDDFPGGPVVYGYTVLSSEPMFVAYNASQLAINMLTSAVQVWRVWVIWSATKYASLAMTPPLLCFLTFSALQTRSNIISATRTPEEFAIEYAKTELAQITLQATTTILATALIATSLIYERWRQNKLIGSESQLSYPYLNIVAILVESYAIESMWTLLLLLRRKDSVAGSFFGSTQHYIEIIAYLLVQYRVSSGRSYESQQKTNEISTLRWNHTARSGAASEADTRPPPSTIPLTENDIPLPRIAV